MKEGSNKNANYITVTKDDGSVLQINTTTGNYVYTMPANNIPRNDNDPITFSFDISSEQRRPQVRPLEFPPMPIIIEDEDRDQDKIHAQMKIR